MIVFAFVHVAARPRSTENTSALITGIICGISNWNTAAGSAFKPSTSDTMDRFGIIAYPALIEKRAAPIEET